MFGFLFDAVVTFFPPLIFFRVSDNKHHPTDVIAGSFLGLIVASIVVSWAINSGLLECATETLLMLIEVVMGITGCGYGCGALSGAMKLALD